nr:MAG TPA: nucleic-acid-binding protein [Caudoviricetes sp.]
MTFNYKREFGKKIEKKSAVPRCQYCGEPTVCAMPVFLRIGPTDNNVVCYKNICISCGKIQAFVETDATGNQKKTYAFFMGSARKCRDFFLPRPMYETDGGKADVGLKVRIIRALLALQVRNPTEKEFTKEQVYEEIYKQEQGQ